MSPNSDTSMKKSASGGEDGSPMVVSATSTTTVNGGDCDFDGNADGNSVEDDPVVHELPVYLSRHLLNRLYLLQYPMRPAQMPYDMSTVVEAKVRPRGKAVQLTMSVDTESANYSFSRGQQIALNVDGANSDSASWSRGLRAAKKSKVGLSPDGQSLICDTETGKSGPNFPSGVMDKIVLESSRVSSTASNFAIGILGSNELHITPLTAIASMRPVCKYLDGKASTRSATAKSMSRPEWCSDDDGQKDGEGCDGGSDSLQAVTVKFASSSIESAKRRQEKRQIRYGRLVGDSEPWSVARFHEGKSAMWQNESQFLFCDNMQQHVLDRCESQNSDVRIEDSLMNDKQLTVAGPVEYLKLLSCAYSLSSSDANP